MNLARLLQFLLALLAATAVGAQERLGPQRWVDDGVRRCVFNDEPGEISREVRCREYHQEIKHRLGTLSWSQWRYMWKYGDRFEVRYMAQEGALGMSSFTIGVLYDKRANFSGRKNVRAVSYSESREELVIGVPNEGYVFTMKGELG